MKIEIKELLPDEIESFLELAQIAAISPLSKEKIERYCFGRTRLHQVILAKIDGNPVGFTFCADLLSLHDDALICSLHHLFVKEEFRYIGIASLLMNQLKLSAKDRGCVRIDLSVGIANTKASNLYEKLGFSLYGASDWCYQMKLN